MIDTPQETETHSVTIDKKTADEMIRHYQALIKKLARARGQEVKIEFRDLAPACPKLTMREREPRAKLMTFEKAKIIIEVPDISDENLELAEKIITAHSRSKEALVG
jgi:hypothetical protein